MPHAASHQDEPSVFFFLWIWQAQVLLWIYVLSSRPPPSACAPPSQQPLQPLLPPPPNSLLANKTTAHRNGYPPSSDPEQPQHSCDTSGNYQLFRYCLTPPPPPPGDPLAFTYEITFLIQLLRHPTPRRQCLPPTWTVKMRNATTGTRSPNRHFVPFAATRSPAKPAFGFTHASTMSFARIVS
jgi:hypothetical protein